ncbi:hypothetical protein [Corynebacterium simulans]|uniref:hypothetical protein n=1 Tax=Corynebacterium simulans TaxID=146827 RepID=UPI000785EAD0|nr:hypothetical protein [Corynebacterium simulans]
MSKWKVRGGRLRGSTFWEVFNHNGRFMESFDTHAEALAYADQKARTREYVLPSQPLPLTLPGVEDDTPIVATYDKDDCVYLTDQDDGEMVVIYTHELRPLALALLAHTERMGQ